jgi:hypothetical protein
MAVVEQVVATYSPVLPTVRFIRMADLIQRVVIFGFMVGLLLPAVASASPRLRCQLSQGDAVEVLDFTPVMDPYTAKAVDIRGNFRFKAVVIGDERKIDYIKLYTYYLSKRQAVLLHEARYSEPRVGTTQDQAALTGTNFFYSPVLERELQYGCALIEVSP